MAKRRRSRKKRGSTSWQTTALAALGVVLVVAVVMRLSTDEQELIVPEPSALEEGLGLERGVTEDGRPFVGSADAPVTVYEFADFQCSHCRDFAQSYAYNVQRDYVATGRARLVFVHFPFIGPESNAAAKAAVCAGDQDAFWVMHDWLFANQTQVNDTGSFSSGRLAEMAEGAGLDVERFEDCLGDRETQSRVDRDKRFGDDEGVESTPGFLVGDTLILGNDMTKLGQAIEAAPGG